MPSSAQQRVTWLRRRESHFGKRSGNNELPRVAFTSYFAYPSYPHSGSSTAFFQEAFHETRHRTWPAARRRNDRRAQSAATGGKGNRRGQGERQPLRTKGRRRQYRGLHHAGRRYRRRRQESGMGSADSRQDQDNY